MSAQYTTRGGSMNRAETDYKYHHFESYIGREEAPMKVRVSYLASAKTGRTSPNDWAMLDDMIVCPFAGNWQGVDLSEALSPETLERIQREALRHYMDLMEVES